MRRHPAIGMEALDGSPAGAADAAPILQAASMG